MKARSAGRLIALFVMLIIAFAGVTGRLFWLQVMNKDRFSALAAVQREREVTLSAERGPILDRNGAELALSIDAATVFADPRQVTDPKGAATALAPHLGIPVKELEAKMRKPGAFVYLARKIPVEVGRTIEGLQLSGIGVVPEPKRVYPSRTLAANVVGFTGIDTNGLGGLEARHDKTLAGQPGYRLIEKDPKGGVIPAAKSEVTAPVSGQALRLTIDKQIQYAAEQALASGVTRFAAKGGVIIVMKPSTGEIFAMANYPTFDPNNAAGSKAEDRRNTAATSLYEPGSANKVITTAAALEAGLVKPTQVMSVPDKLRLGPKVFKDAHPHPVWDIPFEQVLIRSSNVGMIKVAQQLGKDRLHSALVEFGYGRPTGLGFPGEGKGLVPKPSSWSQTSLPTIAIGQGIAVTPIQALQVYATIANGGVMVKPSLVASPTEPPQVHRVLEKTTATTLSKMLVAVTEDAEGTGKAAQVPGYQVAGKTGTAQKPRSDARGYAGFMASFAGFAPAARPVVAVLVILDEPTPIWGGVTAAPIFSEVMRFTLRRLAVAPGDPLVSAPQPEKGRSTPQVPHD